MVMMIVITDAEQYIKPINKSKPRNAHLQIEPPHYTCFLRSKQIFDAGMIPRFAMTRTKEDNTSGCACSEPIKTTVTSSSLWGSLTLKTIARPFFTRYRRTTFSSSTSSSLEAVQSPVLNDRHTFTPNIICTTEVGATIKKDQCPQ